MLKKGDKVRLSKDYEIAIQDPEMLEDVFGTAVKGTEIAVAEDQKEDFGFYADFTDALKHIPGVASTCDPVSWVDAECIESNKIQIELHYDDNEPDIMDKVNEGLHSYAVEKGLDICIQIVDTGEELDGIMRMNVVCRETSLGPEKL